MITQQVSKDYVKDSVHEVPVLLLLYLVENVPATGILLIIQSATDFFSDHQLASAIILEDILPIY